MKTLDEELEDALIHIDTLNEVIDKLLPIANHWYEYLKAFESWAKDDNPPPDWFNKLPEYEAIIANAKKLTTSSPAESKREEK